MSFETTDSNQLPILTIDPEFKALIPPLLPEERTGLEQSILNEGCRDALVTWHGVLIDGHSRYEICKKHGIQFQIIELDFDDRDDVIDWIYQNQLSKRNLTDEKRAYVLGCQYRHRKKRVGAPEGNQNASENKDAIIAPLKTDEIIAEKFNVSPRTVHNAEKYADAVITYTPHKRRFCARGRHVESMTSRNITRGTIAGFYCHLSF